MSRLGAIVLAALLLPIAVPTGAAQSSPRWWDPPAVRGPDDFQDGWNLRVPIRVTNTRGYTLPLDQPILAHLHANQLAAEAGWVADSVAGIPVARNFPFDADSVRVVAYGANWVGAGQEVPSRTYPVWFEPEQTARYGRTEPGAFSPSSNPVVTVLWLLDAPLAPGASLYYYAYFETTTNSNKAPPTYEERARERLAAAWWMGKSTEAWGHVTGGTATNLRVMATEPDTTVSVLEYKGGFPRPTLRHFSSQANPAILASGGDQAGFIVLPPDVGVKVTADKPVLVSNTIGDALTDFIPSLDHNLVGTRFRFRAPAAGAVFLLTASEEARIRVEASDGSQAELVVDAVDAFAELPLEAGLTYAVESDAAIAIQPRPTAIPDTGAPTNRLVQVPSIETGSPIGRSFYGATHRFSSGGVFRFLGLEGAAHPYLFDLPVSGSLHPPPDTAPTRMEPGFPQRVDLANAEVPFFPEETFGPPVYSLPHFGWSSSDDALPVDARSPFAFFVGLGQTPATPAGGREGLRFSVAGPALLFGHYNATAVELVGSASTRSLVVGRDAYVRLNDEWTEVTSHKPVTIVPIAPSSGPEFTRYFSGRIAQPRVEILQPEYRGFLVRLRSPDGANPVFISSEPGKSLQVPILLDNLARWSGGIDIQDTIQLSASALAPFAGLLRWTGAIGSTTSLTLAGGSTSPQSLEIQVPAELAPGNSVLFRLEARSSKNPNIRDALQLVLSVEQKFGLRLYWESGNANNVKDIVRELEPDAVQTYPFVVENLGSAADSFRFETTPPSLGWSTAVVASAESVVELDRVLDVPGGGKRRLFLRVEAPSNAEQDTFTPFVLQALSLSSVGAGDLIQGLFQLNLRREIGVEAEEGRLEVLPGATSRFALRLLNLGQTASAIELTLPSSLPPGWTARIVESQPSPRSLEVSLTPGQSFLFHVDVAAPAGARFGDFIPVLVQAATVGRQTPVRDAAGLLAVVGRTLDFEATPPAPTTTDSGTLLSLEVHVKHRGNAPAEFTLRPQVLPRGWLAEAPSPLRLAAADPTRAAEGVMKLRLRVPNGTLAGAYDLILRVANRDGGHDDVAAKVTVAQRTRSAFEVPPSGERIGPLETRSLPLTLRNQGNRILTFVTTVEPPVGWAAEAVPSQTFVQPARNASVLVTVTAPLHAARGSHTLRVLQTAQETGETTVHEVPLTFELPDPAVVAATPLGRAVRGAGDAFYLSVVLANRAAVAAIDVAVVLWVDGERVDEVRLERIGPNSSALATLQLVWPDHVPRIRIQLDPDGTSPDAEPDNNLLEVLNVQAPPGARGAPGATLLLAMAALALACIRGGRR